MSVRAGLALAMLLLAADASAADDVKAALAATDVGVIRFASAGTLSRPDPQTPLSRGAPVALSGELALPEGNGPFAAVVLAHGCSGISGGVKAWAVVLREWGYASFVLDSFAGRDLTEVCTNAFKLTGTQRVPDAYGALAV